MSVLRSVAVGSILMGFILGIFEVTVFKNLLSRNSFLLKVSVKIFIYIFAIALFLSFFNIINSIIEFNSNLTDPRVIKSFTAFVGNYAFVSIIIYVGVFSFVGFFVIEAIQGLGLNIVSNFFTGKYEKPRIEERIFMFLDMKSSTTIAEELGNIAYYKLLKSYYKEMTEAIISTRGEIYQYVGDEIVISWPLARGIEKQNCLQCFFGIKESIEKRQDYFEKNFGVFPQFKAGMHAGAVTAGTIGMIKKEILYTGDTLNTTARIQSICNELQSNLLVSSDLVKRLGSDHPYQIEEKGDYELRGKNEKVTLFEVSL
ncbi:MAG: adenylate/guanylate cyclase domain-containing protein [Bacteroidota bacterium]